MATLPLSIALLAAMAADLARVDTVQLEPGWRVEDALLVDVDADGRDDLVLSASRHGATSERRLAIHFQGDTGSFSQEPDFLQRMTPDVVQFAVGDVHPDPGRELILMGPRATFVCRPGAEREQRFEKLLEADLLWQLPHRHRLRAWGAALRDFDADGLQDLLLPEPEGFRVALQDRDASGAAFARSFFLRMPVEEGGEAAWVSGSGGAASWRGSRSGSDEARLSIAVEDETLEERLGPPTLVSVSESVPAPQCIDWDGDGDLDVLAQTPGALHVWLQEPRGSFEAAPGLSLVLPVIADRERRFDASYSSHVLHLDGDGRTDCVILAGDQRADDLRTQTLVFLQGADAAPAPAEAPLFGSQGLPQQVLLLAGLVGRAHFDDVDLDGLPDLVLRVVRPDMIDQLQTISTRRISAKIYVYLNQGGRFSKRPDLDFDFSFKTDGGFGMETRFIGDVTGTGVADLLLRDQGEQLKLCMTRRTREGLSVVARPVWELRLHEDARIVFPAPQDGARPAYLVVERDQVLTVRFP